VKNVCKKRKKLARAGLDVVDIDPQCAQALAELIVDHAMLAFLPHEILDLPQQHGIGDLVTVIAHALNKNFSPSGNRVDMASNKRVLNASPPSQ